MGDLDALRYQAERVATLYGSGGIPPDDLLPADRLWFLVMDAADEIERLRAENDRLRDDLEEERQRRRDDLIGQRYGDERLAELQALIDAWAETVTRSDLDSRIAYIEARDALYAAATQEDDRG